ncbi:ABC transporter ATP-binding protein [Vibrio sp. PP-XX7]
MREINFVESALARLLVPQQGQVLLDGKSVHHRPTRTLARTISSTPTITDCTRRYHRLRDLVSRGRHPYHGLLSRWNQQDDEAVAKALEVTKLTELIEEKWMSSLEDSVSEYG